MGAEAAPQAQPAVTEFRLLGPLEVATNGRTLQIGSQKQRALLALLLVHSGEVLSTDRLVDELWGERPPKTATASLQNLVVQLRKVLPPDVLLTKPPGYVLRVDPDQVDAERFERLVRAARGQEAARRAQILGDALALWRGPPLADVAYEPFAEIEARRLEALRVDTLEERIDADLELGLGGELVVELQSLVAEHPLRERLRSQLMLALYRAGRQAEALEAYHDARRVLVDELGVEPQAALNQLYRSILRQEGALEPSPPVRADDDRLGDVAKALVTGRLVVVLGGAATDELSVDGLPDQDEVAAHLARVFECPSEHARDLAHVAEYVAVAKGPGPLYDELHALYDRDSTPGPAARALAELAGAVRARGAARQLILTTNFDRLIEQAFTEVGEDLDVVVYLALGRHRGKFLHVRADGASSVVEIPNAYTALSLEQTAVLFKIHGGIDPRPGREWESFVVSEDDYIDYLAQAEISVALPVTLAARLRRSHFLFLGYSLRDWSLRVFLHRLFGPEKVGYRSWAVAREHAGIEEELWRQRGIDCVEMEPDAYLTRLRERVEEAAPR